MYDAKMKAIQAAPMLSPFPKSPASNYPNAIIYEDITELKML